MPISTFTAIIAGFFYDLSWIVSANSFFERDTVYQMITAMIFHNALYFGGMLVLTNEKLSIKRCYQLPVGVVAIIGWHYLMHYLVDNEKDVVLKNICEAKILDTVIPAIKTNTGYVVLYYIIAITVLIGAFIAFYAANHAFTRQKPSKDRILLE